MPAYDRLFELENRAWAPPGRTEADRQDYVWNLAGGLYRKGAPDNPDLPAGYTYLGQFLDHDVSSLAGASLTCPFGPTDLHNLRSQRLDLDSVYGGGPLKDPHLYELRDPSRLLTGRNPNRELDLPRNADDSKDDDDTDEFQLFRTALVGDPRNDETILLAQLHLAFLLFHNARLTEVGCFEKARELTRWHYQYMVVNDWLVRLVGADLVQDIFSGCGRPNLQLFRDASSFIPLEFALAAYRAGHSMVRTDYHLNAFVTYKRNGKPFWILGAGAARNDLRGGRILPPHWTLQWDHFIDVGGNPQVSKRIDPWVTPALAELDLPGPIGFTSLAYRTLLRGWMGGLPSGQAVAEAMCTEPLAPRDPPVEDPLWVYVLREAERNEGILGPVGGRIVAETFAVLLWNDPGSYYRVQPQWEPTLGCNGRFELCDFLSHAGVPLMLGDWLKTVETE